MTKQYDRCFNHGLPWGEGRLSYPRNGGFTVFTEWLFASQWHNICMIHCKERGKGQA